MKTSCRLIALAGVATLLTACERPPIEAEQNGYRGTAMVQVKNPRAPQPDNSIPETPVASSSAGPRAGDIYQNVQVLGDLSVAEFTSYMAAITQWVSPEQGCNYCHYPENLADDGKYTKVVSRRMMQMTQKINTEWTPHVQQAGVNCYTCHRGKNVPEYIWFRLEPEGHTPKGYAGNRDGQNMPAESVAYASLPADPMSKFLVGCYDDIRVLSTNADPSYDTGTIQDAEWTEALMTHMSDALGVNCTFCHNSRAWASWAESPPQRVTAWHGIRMVSELNTDYLNPLQPVYPDNRLGPHGDAPKAYCTTCHQGQNKPLGGANMVKDYPAALTGK